MEKYKKHSNNKFEFKKKYYSEVTKTNNYLPFYP